MILLLSVAWKLFALLARLTWRFFILLLPIVLLPFFVIARMVWDIAVLAARRLAEHYRDTRPQRGADRPDRARL